MLGLNGDVSLTRVGDTICVQGISCFFCGEVAVKGDAGKRICAKRREGIKSC